MSHSISDTYIQEKQDVKEIFLDTYQLLTKKQKKIWQVLVWYSNNYRAVFPSHATIAKAAGCCRDTVIEAIKIFKERGWLGVIKRACQSLVYFIDDQLRKLDLTKRETFAPSDSVPTENPTENPTLVNVFNYIPNVRSNVPPKKTEDVHHQKDEKEQIFLKMGIKSQKDKWCLSRFSLRFLRLALEDLQTRCAKDPVRNLGAWITSRCKSYLEKYQGV